MEPKTKNFLWGTVAGVAMIIVAIAVLLTFAYFKGTEIRAERLEKRQKATEEQIQRFGTTCEYAIPEALAYSFKTITPAISALQDGPFDRDQLVSLTEGINNKRDFLRYCAVQIAYTDDSSLKLSDRLMKASSELGNVHVFLNATRLSVCDVECRLDSARRAAESLGKLEIILRGGNES